jgi:hypothetical protein
MRSEKSRDKKEKIFRKIFESAETKEIGTESNVKETEISVFILLGSINK